MSQKPDYDGLYEIAENQAGYFIASQARDVGFTWERLSSNSKKGLFLRVARGVTVCLVFRDRPVKTFTWLGYGQVEERSSPMKVRFLYMI